MFDPEEKRVIRVFQMILAGFGVMFMMFLGLFGAVIGGWVISAFVEDMGAGAEAVGFSWLFCTMVLIASMAFGICFVWEKVKHEFGY